MGRIILVFLLGFLLITASIEAQSGAAELCVKSDSGHAFIAFNTQTGDYKFVRCDGVAFSGTGQVRKEGCVTTLEDYRKSYSVVTSVNVCTQVAKVVVDVPQATTTATGTNIPQMREAFNDSNLRDNICDCTSGGSTVDDDGDPEFIGPPVGGGSTPQSGGATPPPGGTPGEDDPEFIGPPVVGPPGPEPSTTSPEICIQSDTNGNLLVFFTTTGDYKFVRWDGVAFSGTGQLKTDGCFIVLEDRRDNYQVFASVNTCEQSAKVFIDVPKDTFTPTGTMIPAMNEGFADSDLRNNTCASSGSRDR